MTLTVYGYDACSTCRKAYKWLDANAIDWEKRPIKEQPPTRAELEAIVRSSGLPLGRFFNTSGQSYRAGGWSAKRKTATEAEQLDALAADPMLLKRPLVVGDGMVLVGFKEADYAALLG
jgi:arsenate reductase